jgi:hypothetical protein
LRSRDSGRDEHEQFGRGIGEGRIRLDGDAALAATFASWIGQNGPTEK